MIIIIKLMDKEKIIRLRKSHEKESCDRNLFVHYQTHFCQNCRVLFSLLYIFFSRNKCEPRFSAIRCQFQSLVQCPNKPLIVRIFVTKLVRNTKSSFSADFTQCELFYPHDEYHEGQEERKFLSLSSTKLVPT